MKKFTAALFAAATIVAASANASLAQDNYPARRYVVEDRENARTRDGHVRAPSSLAQSSIRLQACTDADQHGRYH